MKKMVDLMTLKKDTLAKVIRGFFARIGIFCTYILLRSFLIFSIFLAVTRNDKVISAIILAFFHKL
jgi:hypothetical protein